MYKLCLLALIAAAAAQTTTTGAPDDRDLLADGTGKKGGKKGSNTPKGGALDGDTENRAPDANGKEAKSVKAPKAKEDDSQARLDSTLVPDVDTKTAKTKSPKSSSLMASTFGSAPSGQSATIMGAGGVIVVAAALVSYRRRSQAKYHELAQASAVDLTEIATEDTPLM
eukprot:m.429979 g.429979  ORF g.429979 m.429979 type:complete len:169 (+) comp17101_c0_seq1:177-683(+)